MDMTLNSPLDSANWLKLAMRQSAPAIARRRPARLYLPAFAARGPVSIEAARANLPPAFIISTSRRRRWLEAWIGVTSTRYHAGH